MSYMPKESPIQAYVNINYHIHWIGYNEMKYIIFVDENNSTLCALIFLPSAAIKTSVSCSSPRSRLKTSIILFWWFFHFKLYWASLGSCRQKKWWIKYSVLSIESVLRTMKYFVLGLKDLVFIIELVEFSI